MTAQARTRAVLARRVPLPVIVVVLAAVLLLSAVVAIGIGSVAVPVHDVVNAVLRHVGGGGSEGPYDFIVWDLRAPRIVQAAFVGTGLAVAGVLAQAMTGNALGDPYVLGLSSGAAVGAVLVITTMSPVVVGLLTLPLAAFLGALAAALVVTVLARTGDRTPPARLVMTGIAVGQMLSGVVSFLLLTTRNTDAQQQVLFWLLGSLAGTQWPSAVVAATAVAVLVVAAVAMSARVNLLVLGDEGAAALGVDAARLRLVLLVVVTLLTGTAVAVAGSIGFIGLVVPNLARLVVGADHRRAVPVAALLGALVLVWADTAARVVLAPTETPIGILTALFGVPVFLFVLRRSATGTSGLT